MNPELKAKWVAALRSGEYQQGRDQLRDGDQFCCLGVLCDLIDPAAWEPQSKWRGVAKTLPCEVCDEAGHQNAPALARMNDSGESFAQIADYIEANL